MSGAEPDQPVPKDGWRDWSLLIYAVRYGHLKIAMSLLDYGADPNQSMPNNYWPNWSLLAYAVWNGYEDLAAHLVMSGAEPDQPVPKDGWREWTLLAYAVRYNYPKLVKVILAQKINPDQTIPNGYWGGWTLLAYATWHNYLEIAEGLVSSGANRHQYILEGRWQGCLLLEYAKANQYKEMVELFGNRKSKSSITPCGDKVAGPKSTSKVLSLETKNKLYGRITENGIKLPYFFNAERKSDQLNKKDNALKFFGHSIRFKEAKPLNPETKQKLYGRALLEYKDADFTEQKSNLAVGSYN